MNGAGSGVRAQHGYAASAVECAVPSRSAAETAQNKVTVTMIERVCSAIRRLSNNA